MESVLAYFPIGVSVIGLITWLSRLEFMSREHHTRIRKIESREDDLQRILQEILNKLENISTNQKWLMKDK